ncbi:hypothetical protein LINGRAHAP2_LOCUS22964 [Linum grandiflorum]
MARCQMLHLRLRFTCFVCSGLRCLPTLLGSALRLGSFGVSLMCD